VIEASQARVPLYLLTADRPPRLRGTGANQTIDQVRLFGAYARGYLEPPVPSVAADALGWRAVGREAVAASGGPQAGPVHVNCSFEEPLVPSGDLVEVPPRDSERVSRPDRNPEPLAADVDRAAAELSGMRGVVVAGSNWWMAPGEVAILASQLRWPLLAEPVSGLRRPAWALAAGQALLGSDRFLERRRPEVVLQIGATPTTRATQRFVSGAERLVVVDLFHVDPDPERHATWRLRADPERLATQLIHRVQPAPEGWKTDWTDPDERARRAMDGVLDATDDATELRLARDLAAAVPEGGTLFVGNSLPIRDLDVAMSPRDGIQVLANRGASGIDGLVSTALGVASAGIGPTFALIGDLSLLHDVGALLWNGPRLPADLVLVVANNRGGAIFGALDQRTLPERDRLFVTPQDVDIGAVCAAAGVGHVRVERMSSFDGVMRDTRETRGIRVIEVAVPAERSRRQRAELQAAVDAAIAER
jgi:2-succinyl-5-enolpyruvyl-6-hydroxy-3-cyclohexene-1-carboxylate synthase